VSKVCVGEIIIRTLALYHKYVSSYRTKNLHCFFFEWEVVLSFWPKVRWFFPRSLYFTHSVHCTFWAAFPLVSSFAFNAFWQWIANRPGIRSSPPYSTYHIPYTIPHAPTFAFEFAFLPKLSFPPVGQRPLAITHLMINSWNFDNLWDCCELLKWLISWC